MQTPDLHTSIPLLDELRDYTRHCHYTLSLHCHYTVPTHIVTTLSLHCPYTVVANMWSFSESIIPWKICSPTLPLTAPIILHHTEWSPPQSSKKEDILCYTVSFDNKKKHKLYQTTTNHLTIMNPFMMHDEEMGSFTSPILEHISSTGDDVTSTLFLGDLSVICDEVKLYELFYRFGVIESVQLKKSDRDPERAHLGFGFIKFATRDSAERALQEMNGHFLLGRAMRVGWAVDLSKSNSPSLTEQASNRKKNQTAQIHVMFVTRELNRRVSELDFGAVFSQYGNLVDIAIKKNAVNHVREAVLTVFFFVVF